MTVTNTGRARELFSVPERYLVGNPFVARRAAIVAGLVKRASMPIATVLDIGCGDGTISLQFIGNDRRVVLVDASVPMLDLAAKRVPAPLLDRVSFVHADLADYEPETPADLVLCLGVLAHVESAVGLVTQLARYVAPGGLLIVQFTDCDRVLGRVQRLVDSIRRRWSERKAEPSARTSLRDVRAAAERSGLCLQEVKYHALVFSRFGVVPSTVLERWDRGVPDNPVLSRLAGTAIAAFTRPMGS